MGKPILLVDFGRLMEDQLRNGLNINKKTFILDEYVVDAIPIEWIEDYIAKRSSMSGVNWSYVEDMIKDWEKENEIN